MRVVFAALLVLVLPAPPAAAAPGMSAGLNPAALDASIARAWSSASPAPDPLAVNWTEPALLAAADPIASADEGRDGNGAGAQRRGRPKIYVYSHAYDVRNQIHHYASYAMLPLFGIEAFAGAKLYNNPVQTRTLRSWHNFAAVGIFSLFGVNTFTGVWNLWDGRKDPNGRTLRFVHAALMLASDALFVATAASAPNSRTLRGLTNFETRKQVHLHLAVAGISTAATGWIIMLFRH